MTILPARRSYDELQRSAVRVRCLVCQREYDMTRPARICIACRNGKPIAGHVRPLVDVNGNGMPEP